MSRAIPASEESTVDQYSHGWRDGYLACKRHDFDLINSVVQAVVPRVIEEHISHQVSARLRGRGVATLESEASDGGG